MMEAPRSLLPPQTQEGIYLYQVARAGWHSSAPVYSSTRKGGKTHQLDAFCRPLGTKSPHRSGEERGFGPRPAATHLEGPQSGMSVSHTGPMHVARRARSTVRAYMSTCRGPATATTCHLLCSVCSVA